MPVFLIIRRIVLKNKNKEKPDCFYLMDKVLYKIAMKS